ncbi:MAG: STAS domain-containing protein [Bacteroidales bacterium]|nr:STAS domain-containing protein [Bacteroidales bacterium]
MKTIIEEKNGVVVVSVQGELDTDTSAQFQRDIEPLMERKDTKVEMDLSKLEYMSSKALRILVAFQQAVTRNGGSFSITKVTDTVQEVFDMTGLSASFLR